MLKTERARNKKRELITMENTWNLYYYKLAENNFLLRFAFFCFYFELNNHKTKYNNTEAYKIKFFFCLVCNKMGCGGWLSGCVFFWKVIINKIFNLSRLIRVGEHKNRNFLVNFTDDLSSMMMIIAYKISAWNWNNRTAQSVKLEFFFVWQTVHVLVNIGVSWTQILLLLFLILYPYNLSLALP